MARKSSSSTPPSLKQSVLGFTSNKRTSSNSNSNSKGKQIQKHLVRTISTPTKSARSSFSGSDQGPIEVCSSEDEIANDEHAKRNITNLKDIALTKKSIGKGKVDADILRSAENVGAAHEGKNLDTQDRDGRWTKHYRAVKKTMGSVEPIHAGKHTKVHHILRIFDLSYQYGPCIGVSRLERWERASALGLHPPTEVHEILLTDQGRDQDEFSQTVFYGEV
jgi:DNA polymerase delta subunit 4